jgi:serine/threonine protein kinase
MDYAEGVVLGDRYELLARIGKGGVGEVWSARDRQSGVEVAVKLLRGMYRSNADIRERFAREAQVLARIDSPHVYRLLDFVVQEDAPFLVCERLRGTSLDKLLERGRALPLAEVAPLVDDVFTALADAHAVGVIHRDLKPANIFVEATSAGSHAKLIDFGIGKLLRSEWVTLTTAKATLGSPKYMAPEQLGNAAAADERCDIYAAATVAFRALTGTLPFPQDRPAHILMLKTSYPAATLEEATKRPWPSALQRFFDITLARDPGDRPRTAAEARVGWRRATAEATSADLPTSVPEGPAGDDGETPVLSRRRR